MFQNDPVTVSEKIWLTPLVLALAEDDRRHIAPPGIDHPVEMVARIGDVEGVQRHLEPGEILVLDEQAEIGAFPVPVDLGEIISRAEMIDVK